MNFETFGKKESDRRDKRIDETVDWLLTNGQGQKGTRLVIWNDNAQKYADLGGWGRSALKDFLADLYDAGYADGAKKK